MFSSSKAFIGELALSLAFFKIVEFQQHNLEASLTISPTLNL